LFETHDETSSRPVFFVRFFRARAMTPLYKK